MSDTSPFRNFELRYFEFDINPGWSVGKETVLKVELLEIYGSNQNWTKVMKSLIQSSSILV